MADPISGLTREQSQEYNKYKKIELYFTSTVNAPFVAGYPPLATEVTEFSTNITDVENLLPKKTKDNTGITDEKDIRKEKVAEYWYTNVLAKAKAYAFKVRDTELAVNLSKSKTDIEDMRDGDVHGFCEGISDVLTPLVADPVFVPYGVTAAVLTAGMTEANNFKDYIGKTKDANALKTVAAGSIDLEFTELRNNNIQFRLLMEHFKVSRPDFYNGFIAVDVEDDIGVRHTGIEGTVTNKSDGALLKDAVIKNLTKNKTTKSLLTGEYKLIKQMPGACEIEVTYPGKKKILKVVTMKRGKIIDMDFEMENE